MQNQLRAAQQPLHAARTRRTRVARRSAVAAASKSEQTQTYSAGKVSVTMPLGAVQQMPEVQQALIVAGVFAALGVSHALSCAYLAPALERLAPDLFAWSRSTWPVLASTFVAAGVAHFTLHDEFCTMMPVKGAWGVWHLPGTPSFHVNWTGAAEMLGGAAVLLGTYTPLREVLPTLAPTAALGLYALTWAVTPANVYMATHNAPGPGPAGTVIPPAGHAVRFLLQVFLLSTLWGVAHPPAV